MPNCLSIAQMLPQEQKTTLKDTKVDENQLTLNPIYKFHVCCTRDPPDPDKLTKMKAKRDLLMKSLLNKGNARCRK